MQQNVDGACHAKTTLLFKMIWINWTNIHCPFKSKKIYRLSRKSSASVSSDILIQRQIKAEVAKKKLGVIDRENEVMHEKAKLRTDSLVKKVVWRKTLAFKSGRRYCYCGCRYHNSRGFTSQRCFLFAEWVDFIWYQPLRCTSEHTFKIRIYLSTWKY